jgi:hypothetical protein
MQVKWWRSGFFYLLILAVVLALVFALMPSESPRAVALADFANQARPQQLDTIGYWQEGQKLIGLEDAEVISWTQYTETPEELSKLLDEEGVNFNEEKKLESDFDGAALEADGKLNDEHKVTQEEFMGLAKQGQIDTIEHDGETLTGLKDDTAIITTVFKADTDAVVDYLDSTNGHSTHCAAWGVVLFLILPCRSWRWHTSLQFQQKPCPINS